MEKIENLKFGNEDTALPKKCILNLFNTLFQRNNNDYELTLTNMAQNFLVTSKKDRKEKTLMIMYMVTKYAELNNYRHSLGMLDKDDESLQVIKDIKAKERVPITSSLLRTIINDTLYYAASTNKLFQQDAINCSVQSGLNKASYQICPTVLMDHLNTLLKGYSGKEALLENIIKAVTIAFDRRLLASNIHPSPKDKIFFLRKIRFPSVFHQEVLQQFNSQLNITEEENDEKVQMCEMIYSVLSKKEKSAKLTYAEYQLLQRLKTYPFTQKGISDFYNEHGTEIINYFITNINSFEQLKKEGLFEDQEEFSEAKKHR